MKQSWKVGGWCRLYIIAGVMPKAGFGNVTDMCRGIYDCGSPPKVSDVLRVFSVRRRAHYELFGCPLMFVSRDQGRGVRRYDVTVDSEIWREEKSIMS